MSLELFKQCSPKCRKYQRNRCQWSRSKCAIAVVSFAFGHLWNQFSKGVYLENIFSRTTEMATMNNSPSLFYLTITKSSNLIMNKKWFHWNSCLHFSFWWSFSFVFRLLSLLCVVVFYFSLMCVVFLVFLSIFLYFSGFLFWFYLNKKLLSILLALLIFSKKNNNKHEKRTRRKE